MMIATIVKVSPVVDGGKDDLIGSWRRSRVCLLFNLVKGRHAVEWDVEGEFLGVDLELEEEDDDEDGLAIGFLWWVLRLR
ncbi:hypothetical protein GOP47_0010095 [Adiantum capillus-veneris]|uniref:Uncharacterized protein n=1 Tax=Adiantum capillus-veneris TaxID=13818 RepID=A0A9D4UU46_ADICA|nr:hypothetical protein GOP47_0010095 [Adiantum capillus-veneris]